MSRPVPLPLQFRLLHDSALVSVRGYYCCAGRGGPAAEEYSGRNDIVLIRDGAFCKHFGRRSVTAEDKVHVHDLHATLLHLLGFDHERLTYRYAGRDFRLTDVHGHVVKDILA